MLAYAAFGFWGVPALVESQLPKQVQQASGRQLALGEVAFNPFTLRLGVQGLRLAEADGAPLLSVEALQVEPQWRSVVRRAWSFREISLAQPRVHLLIAPDGRFNIAELVASFQKTPQKEPTGELPRIIIERLAVNGGELVMEDRRAGYANHLSPIDFELANFSTLSEQAESYTLRANFERGGTLSWKGSASVNPIRARGEIRLENVSLAGLGAYLKPFTQAVVDAGTMSATLPYELSYESGRLDARLADAGATLSRVSLARAAGGEPVASLSGLQLDKLQLDLASRELKLGTLRASGGSVRARRDARGEVDLANLLAPPALTAKTGKTGETGEAVKPAPSKQADEKPWRVAIDQVRLDKVSLGVTDQTVDPPVRLAVADAGLQLRVAAAFGGATDVKLSQGALSLAGLTVANGEQPALAVDRLGLEGAEMDLAGRKLSAARVFAQGGQLTVRRDARGGLNLLGLVPGGGDAAKQDPPAGKPWQAHVAKVELTGWQAAVEDQSTGLKANAQAIRLALDDVRSDPGAPIRFDAGLNLREGGQLTARGTLQPAQSALQVDLGVQQLALAPLQPLLAQYVRLKIARGSASAAGKLEGSFGDKTQLRYQGSVDVADLRLDELNGKAFASWKAVRAPRVTASVGPNRLNIPELDIVQPSAQLIIEADRSFNAARLLVKSGETKESPSTAKASASAESTFPVRLGRVRVQDAKLEFADNSLRPPFAATLVEMNGVIAGVSTQRKSPSSVELQARVDQYGSARIEGKLNPFAPTDDTDLHLVFKNLDMVSVSPYSMKFAGYRVADGRMSLDLQYKVRDSRLEATNQIVIDRLQLGERVESPDALKLPLDLAIAVLKDGNGRIDLGLPVSGDLNDPQFSWGAVIGKAIGNVLARAITAPFRALGRALGLRGGGENLEAIDFIAGSEQLAPPERAKIEQIVRVLGERQELGLSVVGSYSPQADGAALRKLGVRQEVFRRTGASVEAQRDPGPLDLSSRSTRRALRELYAARFGDAALDEARQAAEQQAQKSQDSGPALLQRAGRLVSGEPQVADLTPFYEQLLARLEREQPVAQEALGQLAAQRADAVVAALRSAGIAPARLKTAQPRAVEAAADKPVPVALELGLAGA